MKAALRWLPVALGLAALAGFVGYRLVQRVKERSPGVLRGTPISAPALERDPSTSGPTADLLNRLGLAMSLRDAQTAERLAEELSRGGDAILPGLVRLLLRLDPIPPEPVFDVVLKYFPPRPVAMTAIMEVSTTLWLGIGPAPRQLRIKIARGILRHSKEQDPAIDLGSLLSSRFARTARIDGRLGLTLLAIHLKDPAWETFVRTVLPALKDRTARDELLATIAELFGRQGATVLGPLLFDPAYADAKTAILPILLSELPPDETLSLLLSTIKPDAEAIDQLILSDAVAAIVEKTGMDPVRRVWSGTRGVAPKTGILMGLGDLKTRQDVGDFLLTVARSSEAPDLRGTALLSLSRQNLNNAEAFAVAAGHLAATTESDDVTDLKSYAILALANLSRKNAFVSETREAFQRILEKESDSIVVRACLTSAIDLKMVALRESVQKLALNSPNVQVKAACEQYLRLVR